MSRIEKQTDELREEIFIAQKTIIRELYKIQDEIMTYIKNNSERIISTVTENLST